MRNKLVWITCVVFCLIAIPSFARTARITVCFDKELGFVNRKVFGNNIPGYDNKKHINSNFGAGIWNPNDDEMVQEVIELAKSSGISVLRFNTRNYYDWKKAIGKGRKNFRYGVDEFLKTASEIGAEPVFIISYFVGSKEDAADFVEYLNAPVSEKNYWSNLRAANGHKEPYHIKYFEFGNEIFGGRHKDKNVTPEKYASKYLVYQSAMKAVDPSIQLGVNLHHNNWQWDREVIATAGAKADFVIKHIYPPRTLPFSNSSVHYKGNDLFQMILGSLVYYNEKQFALDINHIKEFSGRDDIYFAITEYNIGLAEAYPQYRHSLGAALVNADLIRIFLKPENKIVMANYWHLSNAHWGMIKTERKNSFIGPDYRKPISYIKRPNYSVYEMYNRHFGDLLVETIVNCDSFNMAKYEKYMKAIKRKKPKKAGMKGKLNNFVGELFFSQDAPAAKPSFVPYLSVNASKSSEGNKIYLMVVNKNMDEAVNTVIDFHGFLPSDKAYAWILNGPSVESTNEVNSENVSISRREVSIKDNAIEFNFESHSLTAIEITKD